MSKLWLTSAAADGADNSLISSSYVCLCTSATSFCALNDAWHVVAGRAIQREHGSGEDPRDERSVAGLPHAAICRLISVLHASILFLPPRRRGKWENHDGCARVSSSMCSAAFSCTDGAKPIRALALLPSPLSNTA